MDRFVINEGLAEIAVSSRRFELLSKLGTDVATIGTWDIGLSRRTRILVPIDVQAYVVPVGGTEPTVDLVGDPEDDPAPFGDGAARPVGVHLHWAMPDALLRTARPDPARPKPELPSLPDQWVVVRTLQPVGHRQVLATGWVIDARTRMVTPLPAFTGPASIPTEDPNSRLDGFSGGAHWTSSYSASEGRFTFHDPLSDLDQLGQVATAGFDGNQAVYTVAGWWSDATRDPLSGARGSTGLDSALAGLGWDIDHDLRDTYLEERDTREIVKEVQAGLKRPKDYARNEVFGSDGRRIEGIEGTDMISGSPFLKASRVAHGDSLPRYDSLLHGSVLGVPIGGALPGADDKPDPSGMTVAVGSDVDDVIAAMGAARAGLGVAQRRAAEDLLAAFSHGLVAELGTPDGLDQLGHREHESGFWSLPGAPVPAMKPDLLRDQAGQGADPLTVGRHGRAGMARSSTGKAFSVTKLAWSQKTDLVVKGAAAAAGTSPPKANPKVSDVVDDEPPMSPTREVLKAAPRYFRPAPLVLAIRGARPSHRHHGDGLFNSEGKLLCRYPRAAVPRYTGLVEGAQVLPTLGSGAIPNEVVTVVREAVLLNPYGRAWLVDAAGADTSNKGAISNRLDAEMVRLFGAEGKYDGSSHVAFVQPKTVSVWDEVGSTRWHYEQQISAVLAGVAIAEGQPPSPVAITTWRQPWIPIWLEWRVTVTGTTTVRGWKVTGHDLEPEAGSAAEPVLTRTLTGRGLLGKGVGETLRAAVKAWLASEAQRHATPGRTAYGSGAAVQRLADLDHPLDLISGSLDGLREQLLGIDFMGGIKRQAGKPVASADPVPLFGGTVRIEELRIVDAFGRFVTVDGVLDQLRTTLELEVDGEARTLRLRPRLQNAARWLWRLVDPGQLPETAPDKVNEAFVNQVSPSAAVNPVSGFLLPDHIDEALEAFTVSGAPIGQVLHDPVTNAVNWECAPGRPVPPDAGPLVDIAAQERIVAEIAAGMISADAAARDLPTPPRDTALTAFLRAVDSTLWTVDTFASLGDSSLAGLVGRPIAVVRSILTLDAPDDVDELTLAPGVTAESRKAAYGTLGEEGFEIQLGTLGRADDTLLGFFVDDDYEKFFIVDKVVAELARRRPTGRHLGHLGVLGSSAAEDPMDLDHPYLSDDNRIIMRRGQTKRLTMLMIPGGRVHLTSGILPRKDLALADAWFSPGLKKLMPSLRVGPLLVDPGEIRLPLVSILGESQTFTRRTGELAWKDDAILAATQTAYLPRMPHEVQEGWIRVTPTEEGES